jgi:hypothetical protein
MTPDDTRITLPTIILRNHRFNLRIDTGELLFPVIVFTFCIAYYVETRGLPAESMLYAGPLLYATASLSVITMFGHAISVDTGAGNEPTFSSSDSHSVVWGVEGTVAEKEHPQNDAQPAVSDRSDKQPPQGKTDAAPHFNVRSAIGLVVLVAVYIFALYLVPFVFATVPFLAAAVYLFGERDVLRIVVYSIGFALLLRFVFINWLEVPLS